jgi:hypothetical protein
MYNWVLYYDLVSNELFCVKFYLDGLYSFENLPDRFFHFVDDTSMLYYAYIMGHREWHKKHHIYFDEYLEHNDCVAIGHVE